MGGLTVIVFGLTATAAEAASDFWLAGTLDTHLGFASTEAHSITYIQGSADHNGFCVAKDTGLAGYATATRATAGTQACATSGGFASRTENGACCFHGWLANKNSFEISVNATTRYDY